MNFFKNIYKKIKGFWRRDKRVHLSISGISVNFDWYSLLIIGGLLFVFSVTSSIYSFRELKTLISENVLDSEDIRVKDINIEDIRSIIEKRGGSQKDDSDTKIADDESLPADENQ